MLLAITIITLDSRGVPIISNLRDGASTVFSPVTDGLGSLTKPIRSWWGGTTRFDEVEAENAELREQVDKLTAEIAEQTDAKSELQRILEQEGIPFVEDLDPLLGSVATGPYSSFDDNTLQLDRGSNDGVKVGMTVVTNAGLVGKIQAVTSDRSTMMLITSPDFEVGVKLVSTGNYASGRGSGPTTPFLIYKSVELEASVEEGELVTTSGLESSSFPPGIPIGVVSAVAKSQEEQTYKLEVEISADLTRLDFVQILRWESEE